MSTAQMAKVIGKVGMLRTEGYGFLVAVEILDVKQAYGNTRYVVSPVAGEGTITVDDSRVTIKESV